MRILIPNATGGKNLGDQAILRGLLSCLTEAYGKFDLVVHSYDPDTYDKNFPAEVDYSLYTWTVFENQSFLSRIWRMWKLGALIIINLIRKKYKTTDKIQKLLDDYKTADLILYVGGGYFRSKKGFTQSLNLLMQLLLFWVSRISTAPTIVCPITIGPFAYAWQKNITCAVLKQKDVVHVREQLSFDIAHNHGLTNIVLAPDTAFFLEKKQLMRVTPPIFGFTIREWLDADSQDRLERYVAKAIQNFLNNSDMVVLPFVQVDGKSYGESDLAATTRVASLLAENGVYVLPVKQFDSLDELQNEYRKVSMFLGMRMHSNILAAVQGVPFVAISYEYKTEGIMNMLGLAEYTIKSEMVTDTALLRLFKKRFSSDYKEIGANMLVAKEKFVATLKKYEHK